MSTLPWSFALTCTRDAMLGFMLCPNTIELAEYMYIYDEVYRNLATVPAHGPQNFHEAGVSVALSVPHSKVQKHVLANLRQLGNLVLQKYTSRHHEATLLPLHESSQHDKL